PWPTYDKIAKPLLGLLGPTQVALPGDDEVSKRDAEALARQESQRQRRSQALAKEHVERFGAAETMAALQEAGQKLTEAVKKQFLPGDLERVRQAYSARQGQLQKATSNGATQDAAPVEEPAVAG